METKIKKSALSSFSKAWGIVIIGFSTVSIASPGEELFAQQCQSCHDLSAPASDTLKKMWNKKGPDLSSAGIKYNAEWMMQWLQNPIRIRPAGMYYGNHIESGEKGDQINNTHLVKHPHLSLDDSSNVVAMLMTLNKNQALIKKGEYKQGTIPMTLGEMVFDKFKGCLACHQIEPGYGGLSGPEVYSAGKRLQKDYLISFMRNPQAWNPKTLMPNKNLKDSDLQKLVHYFRALGKENFK